MESNYIPSILMVDDNESNVVLLQQILRDVNANTVGAYNADEALEHLYKQRFSLILLDVNMPGMSGYDLAEEIRFIPLNRYTPIIFITAVFFDESSISKGYKSGGVDYIVKPLNKDILRSKVDIFLQLDRLNQELENKRRKLEMHQVELVLAQQVAKMGSWELMADGEFLKCSSDTFKIFGINRDSGLIHRQTIYEQIIFPEDRAEYRHGFEKMCNGEEVTNLYCRVKRPNGEIRFVLFRNYVGDIKVNSGRMFGIVQDVTEMQKKDEALRMAHDEILRINKALEQRVEEEVHKKEIQHQLLIQKSKLASLGEMAAGIAHEINQPLGVIHLILDNIALKTTGQDNDDGYLEDKHHAILDNIEKIKHIIEHIRQFSHDQNTTVYENINSNEVIGEALSLIGAQYKQHQIKIDLDLDPLLPLITGNKFKLEQVILNLLSNAKYAVEERKKLAGNSNYQPQIDIQSTMGTDNKVLIIISDNGIGILPDNIERVFDPFFTTKKDMQGTGLGLSVSYAIIQEMKGAIYVESEQNKQTKFIIEIPALPNM